MGWAKSTAWALLVLAGCSDLLVNGVDAPGRDFEAAWQRVDAVYPYFRFKHINWDSLHAFYLPRAEAARGDEIDGVLYALLAELKDAHVTLQTRGGAWVSTYHPPRSERDRFLYSPLAVRKYFQGELRLSGDQRVEYEILQGKIGYIYLATLRSGEPVLEGFDEALAYLRSTSGLIIDVRHNEGGTDYNSMGIVARLITSPIDYLPYPTPDGTIHQGIMISPRGPFAYTRPVVLLIDGVCFSACEDFAEFMKHAPMVTAVGDTTAGGSGAPQTFTLPSLRKISVSTVDIRRYDGLPIEWNGVPPDLRVTNLPQEIDAGVDRQLERALELLQNSSPNP